MRIERILFNLIENAAKYSPEGTEININVTREDKQLTICVADRGMGMPRERLGELFEPFSPPGYPPEHTKGLGLGLVVCKTPGGSPRRQNLGGVGAGQRLGFLLHIAGEDEKGLTLIRNPNIEIPPTPTLLR